MDKKDLNTRRSGFTLLELVVVFSVITILTAGLIFYNRPIEKQIILFREQAKLISLLERAKSLTLTIYNPGNQQANKICGYGVYISTNNALDEYVLFKDLPAAGSPDDCSTANKKYDTANRREDVQRVSFNSLINANIRIENNAFFENSVSILFVPPNLSAHIVRFPARNNTASHDVSLILDIPTLANNAKTTKINQSGQITQE